MTSNHTIHVAMWDYYGTSVIVEKRTHHFWSLRVIALVGTLLLHALVVQTVLLGSRAHPVRPPEVQGPGATLIKSEAAPAETLVLIELPRIVKTDSEILEELASASAARPKKLITTISPDPLPYLDLKTVTIAEAAESAAPVDSGDGAERARLFGIYSGQIQARIERVWRRPRTPIIEGASPAKVTLTDETFQCQVQIVQDNAGNVQEVLLPHCNGTIAWQHSLVLAIQQSSPLPAPPSPSVFSRAVTLNFVGLAYGAGRADDNYETAPIQTAQTDIGHLP